MTTTCKRTFVVLTILTMLFSVNVPMSNGVTAYAEKIFEGKALQAYTMEEYQMMTPQQQDEFFLAFESIEDFEAWMEAAALPMPWEQEKRKPEEYTWNEYIELTNAQQEAFIADFESAEEFESWMESVQPEEVIIMPWEQGEKLPSEYTWAEYEVLTSNQQNMFIEWFGSTSEFEIWLELAKAEAAASVVMPWEEAAQKPNDYTWAEFEALTIDQQNLFIEWFDDTNAFETWMANAQAKMLETSEAVIIPWKVGEKAPDAYTWTEFEALTIDQQEAFIEWFDSLEAFEAWMEVINPSANMELIIPWANDQKQPDAYTADEFEQLTVYQQSRFFVWFETAERFNYWLNNVSLGADEAQQSLNENENKIENAEVTNDAEETENELKVYTWSEYEQMTSEQRILFFLSFESADEFSVWVEASRPDDMADTLMPWDNTKKQPEDYTWKEYEGLSVELQDAFFAWFESAEMFEEWMKTVADQDVLIALGILAPGE